MTFIFHRSHIQGRVQISSELRQLKLGEEPQKGAEQIRDVHKVRLLFCQLRPSSKEKYGGRSHQLLRIPLIRFFCVLDRVFAFLVGSASRILTTDTLVFFSTDERCVVDQYDPVMRP